ncbi:hypothetical protein [Streptomyces sp. 5-10]|uniref:hypothetical protein n=1 Tax=Streptomyces sp. 5-10 TaxID=878925 RepID=UPI00168A98EE|nr:hypothetical protein [Streptomyces sp. 5-10]MBD3004839.1 hypothetical protein [Streptomyces sp. 5-10]
MRHRVRFTKLATDGIKKIKKSGNQGKIRQLDKALTLLKSDPRHTSLQSHRARKAPPIVARFGNRDDLWISYVRTGSGGERIVWTIRDAADGGQVLNVEYVGPHID